MNSLSIASYIREVHMFDIEDRCVVDSIDLVVQYTLNMKLM